MTSVKLTDMMSASGQDAMTVLGTAVAAEGISFEQQSFTKVMKDTSRNYQNSGQAAGTSSRTGSKTDVKESYQANAQSDAMDRKVTKASVETDDPLSGLDEEQSAVAVKFAQDMKDLLTEKLGVSQEELDEAMETLGLTYLDLLNPANLTRLAAQLTGTEDACTLLMNEDFTEILQKTDALAKGLTGETGLSQEQLLAWQESQRQALSVEQETDAAFESGMTLDADQMQADTETMGAQVLTEIPEETGDVNAQEYQSGVKSENSVTEEPLAAGKTENSAEHVSQNDPEGMTALAAEGETDSAGTGEETDFMSGQSGEKTPEKEEGGMKTELFSHTQSGRVETFQAEAVVEHATGSQNNSAGVELNDLLRQFTEFSRLFVSQETTSIDMQLNPEHLGKLYLHISTGREGNVTAEIAATSQEVKEALESQIAELRMTLNQQGVKVDAVEVTVASHEFEQNLEQSTARDQQEGQEQEQQSQNRVRSLMRGELDELNGLASEEEILAAKIMKDNGNSMDVTV